MAKEKSLDATNIDTLIDHIGAKNELAVVEQKYTTGNQDDLKRRQMELDAGWLGIFFGNSKSAPQNIAGLTIIVALVMSIVLSFTFKNFEIWKYTSPIMTLSLGYLFGKKA